VFSCLSNLLQINQKNLGEIEDEHITNPKLSGM
jgi:hypothetical protein